jgi:predicted N-acetyltransferase YhbS
MFLPVCTWARCVTIELITTPHIAGDSAFAAEVHDLLNAAFPEGAPNELAGYYARYGFPTATLLLREDRRVIGHLAIYEREIGIAAETVLVGLLGEVAIAAERQRRGLARRLVGHAHDHLQARAIPFSILFAFEPCVYASSGYTLMRNETRFMDADGRWKTVVYRGGMVAELSARRWPNQPIDLRGPAV